MHNRNSFSFIKKIIFKIYFGCTGSLLLHRLFFSFDEQQLLSSCGAQASHCGGFSCCRAWVLGHTMYNSFSSQVLEHRLNSCGAWGSCFVACGIFSDQGSKLSSALAGRFCITAAVAAAKSLQSCPTLCNPIDGSPPGSPIPGILQARALEWVAISFSNAWKWKVKVKSLSRVRLLATPWTAAYQAPLSMGLSRQEYWSGLPLPSLSVLLSYHESPRNSFSDSSEGWKSKIKVSSGKVSPEASLLGL